jgi:hypothetical protein
MHERPPRGKLGGRGVARGDGKPTTAVRPADVMRPARPLVRDAAAPDDRHVVGIPADRRDSTKGS